VHEFGDMSSMKDGSSAGSHFNPQGHSHGNQTDQQRHVGDLGNIEANDDGVAKIDIRDSMLALDGENSIIGRGLVVHFDEDKFTQPVGDAGGRFAIGVIGVAKK
jgi:Cu-Zn family superoxide dismutase